MLFTPIKPMRASKSNHAFDDDQYIFEPKWDGARILLHKQGERMEAYTRHGVLVTAKFPELREVGSFIQVRDTVLDCEGIVLRGNRAAFDDFAYRLRLSSSRSIQNAVQTHPAVFVAFDMLFSDGRELMRETLLDRKQRLREMVTAAPGLMPTMYVDGQGQALFQLTKDKAMEGIVAKKKDSRYHLDTMSPDWLRINHKKTIDVIILGYRTSPFALVIGLNFRTVRSKPVGIVQAGLEQADQQQLLQLAKPLHMKNDSRTQWIEPQLCCRIDYAERSDMHQLGETVFKCFLPDKKPEDCVWTY